MGDEEARPGRDEAKPRAAGSVFHSPSSGRDGIISQGGENTRLFFDGVAALAAVKGLGPFLDAFARKLGEALGESTAAALGRLTSTRRGRSVLVEAELPGQSEVSLVLEPDTPDEARLALLDLDVTAPELSGTVLHWDIARQAWHPAENPKDTEKAEPRRKPDTTALERLRITIRDRATGRATVLVWNADQDTFVPIESTEKNAENE